MQAQAKATAAFIHERYRGDLAAAIVSYEAALLLNPTDKTSRESLERLQRIDANLKARLKAANRQDESNDALLPPFAIWAFFVGHHRSKSSGRGKRSHSGVGECASGTT